MIQLLLVVINKAQKVILYHKPLLLQKQVLLMMKMMIHQIQMIVMNEKYYINKTI